ncbi:MAG: hypothetical protein LBV57_03005 [Candidatus Symbiothrix sp.]|jgi:hypothetical protein|nr:hypothetical protein [Candidatus Symbiothrix sp.]
MTVQNYRRKIGYAIPIRWDIGWGKWRDVGMLLVSSPIDVAMQWNNADGQHQKIFHR